MAKQICTIEGYQEISPDYYINESGEVFSEGGTRKLKPQPNSDGYIQYAFPRANGRVWRLAVAALVLTAFRSPRPSVEHECDHIDSNKQNNHVSNLRWVHKSVHAHRAATQLTEAQRIAVRVLAHPANDPQNTLFEFAAAGIARLLRLPHRQVSNLINDRTYRSQNASLSSGDVLIVSANDGEARLYRKEGSTTPPNGAAKKATKDGSSS